jgi:hypothetical protein
MLQTFCKHLRLRKRRADGVHPDTGPCIFESGAFREPDDAVLRGSVRRQEGRTGDPGDGRNIENYAASLPLHLHKLMLHGVKNRDKIDSENALEGARVDFGKFSVEMDDAGIVDGDIEPAEMTDACLDKLSRELLLDNIAGFHDRFRASAPHGSGRFLQVLFKDIGQDKPSALGGKLLGG